jgi:hypothetical protein
MSLLNHPNLVSCYCSFVSGPVRAARAPAMRGRTALHRRRRACALTVLGLPRTCGSPCPTSLADPC